MNLTVLLLSILLFTACSSPLVQHDKSSGKTNEVKKGKPFHINLPENHSTGYLWSLSQDYKPETIRYVNSVYHSTNGGNVDYNFEALKAGKTEINLVLRKHTDTSEIKSFVIEVK